MNIIQYHHKIIREIAKIIDQDGEQGFERRQLGRFQHREGIIRKARLKAIQR